MINTVYEDDFVQKVLQADKPVVVDFYADWCAPCKKLSPILNDLSTTYTEFDFYKTNIDENPRLADTFGINSIPNILIFKNGEVCDSSIGFTSAERIRIFLEKNR
ncbi:MAG: thioredoxin [Ruminococcus sp.]|nr:thioredoxin [Ruminococcus sp.]